ncbi:MAG: type IV pilus twitching motility protein PilT [Candidatus Schekmanbacteria bacterium]|nr:type IV pilus twitching motility protein PilT [Candidatus Schekmanbacteria bacterium]
MYEATMEELLVKMVEKKSSDLHLSAGSPPLYRIDGRLVSIGHAKLMPQDVKELVFSVLTERQQKTMDSGENKELDFSFSIGQIGRIRANAYFQRGSYSIALRHLPLSIPTFDELGLPQVLNSLCQKVHGLILVTGPTGNGKSTTLASMIEYINCKYQRHVITVEDPIEYLYKSKKCLISQREVHLDTVTFHNALRTVLRQDPDVVLIGEMRDLETISAALTIAETGHLTFATLHTNSCVETINRVVDVFDENRQAQVRTQLSFVLEAVLSQQLIPRSDGPGRVLSLEIMIPNSAIRNLIREGKIHQIQSIMQTSQASSIMQTMNESLLRLFQTGKISKEEMLYRSPEKQELTERLRQLELAAQGPVKKGLFGKLGN